MLAWPAPSIRLRLTAWYAAVLTAMMIVYATTTFVSVRHELREQLDERLKEDLEGADGRVFPMLNGRSAGLRAPRQETLDEAAVYEAWSAAGEPLDRSGPGGPLPPLALASGRQASRYDTVVVGGQRWRMLTSPAVIDGRRVVLRVARSEERLRRELSEIRMVLVLGLPLVVALAGLGGYVLARRALAPIDHLAVETRRITAERLHERLTAPNPADEIGRLTAVINDTFARLESSFDQLRRFTADASHELRTPLAIVRGIGEAAVAERRSPRDYEEAIGSMLEEIDRMTGLVDTLLRLSHADAGMIRLSRERLDVGQLAREAVSSLTILAEERGQSIACHAAEGLVAPVDRLVLREAITNILDNAIKYSPAGSTILVRVERHGDQALVAVADQGPGIPAQHRERIFHRFFRVDQARTREGAGAGLGLAIAKRAVELHGGQVAVVERAGGGSEFQVRLPLNHPGSG